MRIKKIKTMENQKLLKKCKKIQQTKRCQNCSRKTVAWNWFCNTVTNGNKNNNKKVQKKTL